MKQKPLFTYFAIAITLWTIVFTVAFFAPFKVDYWVTFESLMRISFGIILLVGIFSLTRKFA
jgi:hypothetical protein